MSTATVIAVALWNALLLTVLAVVIVRRTEVLGWITRLDRPERNGSERQDSEWNRFLAEHAELFDR